MPPPHRREHLPLTRLLTENSVEGVSVLPIVHHRRVVLETGVLLGRTETTEHTDVLALFFLLLVHLALTTGVLVEGGLDQGLRQLDRYFGDRPVESLLLRTLRRVVGRGREGRE